MISLKKDYEKTVKLISEEMHLYQHYQLSTVQLPTISQHCPGLSTLYITVHVIHMHTGLASCSLDNIGLTEPTISKPGMGQYLSG